MAAHKLSLYSLQMLIARFFFIKYTKTGGNMYTKLAQNIPNGHEVYQMAVKYVEQMSIKRIIFYCKTLQNLEKFLVLKYTIWQPCTDADCIAWTAFCHFFFQFCYLEVLESKGTYILPLQKEYFDDKPRQVHMYKTWV
jgi:hypothetical protein